MRVRKNSPKKSGHLRSKFKAAARAANKRIGKKIGTK